MLGFEIEFKGELLCVAAENGVVSIIATQLSKGEGSSIDFDIRGLGTFDAHEDELIDWLHASLKEGDEFTVRVKEINEVSPPIKVEKRISGKRLRK
jgi:hypothetical protein